MRGDQDGAGGVDDPPGQVLGLAGAGAAEHHEHVLDGDPHPQQPDPAQLQPDLRGGQREQLPPPRPPRRPRQGRADGGGLAAHRHPRPDPGDVERRRDAGLAAGPGTPPGHRGRGAGEPVPGRPRPPAGRGRRAATRGMRSTSRLSGHSSCSRPTRSRSSRPSDACCTKRHLRTRLRNLHPSTSTKPPSPRGKTPVV